MKPEHWQQVDKLFHAALERAPEERLAFLAEACAGDESLRKQVEDLVAGHEAAGSFIESPAIEVAARSVANDQDESAVGLTIGHYQIVSTLGVGGMGEVYLAQDSSLGRQIALKLLPAAFTRDSDRVRRFQQEARAASALNHPNIVTIHEIGQVDGRHFIANEFIDGETLRQHISGSHSVQSAADGKLLNLGEILNIVIQTADALSAAHEAGIVHRDIKPENIMVRRRDGYVKVLDFGLAKLTEAPIVEAEATTRPLIQTSVGIIMGTAGYMSPEQARGETVDVRTDIWSLGVVLYEMVAGCAPFARPTPSEVIALILEREPPPLACYAREVPPELERIVNKALTKDRERRYQTAKDLLVDLRRLKQQREFEAEIERTQQPEEKHSELKAIATDGDQRAVTAPAAAVETDGAAVVHAKSSAAYLVKHHRGALMAITAFVIVTAVAAYFAYSRYWAKGNGPITDSTVGIHSIAVLPFANQSNNPDMEYLSDGISESLTNSLSQLPGMTVIASRSCRTYKGKNPDPQEAATALGAEALVTGTVTQRGDSLSISVELMDARNKRHVWGEQYNRKTTDLLAIQSDISREIASTLRVKLTNAEQQQLAKRETADPQAYDLLLKGLFYSRRARIEDQKKAVDYYQQATAMDPKYALAFAALAAGYNSLYGSGILDPKELKPKAEAAVNKALELDESLAEGHFTLADLKMNAWEWASAEREYRRAIELNPNLAQAHFSYATYLMVTGRHEEALAEAKRARELDPLSLWSSVGVANRLCAARRYDEAIDVLKKTLELDQNFPPTHYWLANAYAAKGMYPEAIAESLETIRLAGDSPTDQIYLGATYAKAGERLKAREILKRLQTSKEYISPTELAVLYVALGEREQAFALLEKGYAAHDLQLQYLVIEEGFDSLRVDSRFKDLMRRVGLPQ
jgi:serine/threonine-protein kinase